MTRTTNVFTDRTSTSMLEQSVDTDGNGDVTVTVGGLREIEGEEDVSVEADAGFVAGVQSVDGNSVTIRVYQGDYGAGAAGPLVPITGTNGVTDLRITAVGQ